jgi:hypothetical protein
MTTENFDKPKPPADERPIKLLHESCFWDEEDPRWQWMNSNNNLVIPQSSSINSAVNDYHDICLDVDSYIFVFTGRRGGGKTTSMTDEAAKAMVIYPRMRLLSNYPIEFKVIYLNGQVRHIKSEDLDLYKLLCFDDEYHECLICIDEAPDIISHMAAMTWKNRLLNIFIRQLRKNRNSLMLGAQAFNLIDKSMRWQVDVLIECEDASRKYGWPADTRGELILQRWLDNSGMWTGQTWDQQQDYNRSRGIYEDVGEERELYPRFLWSDEKHGGHKAVFDTYFQQDVWESLRKVDMNLDSYEVGDKTNPEDKGDMADGSTPFMRASESLRNLLNNGASEIAQTQFWKSVGNISKKAKDSLAKRLSDCGLNGDVPKKNYQRMYDLTNFDMDAFLRDEEE